MKTKTTTLASLLAITLTAAGQTPTTGGIMADFNGDGFADLAIGSPSEDFDSGLTTSKPVKNAGAVTVIYGSSIGLATYGADGAPSSTTWHQNSSGIQDSCETDDNFGATLAAGDINGDGYADLAIAVPGEKNASGNSDGAVQVLYGSAKGLTAIGNTLIRGGALNAYFIASMGPLSMSCADFNGDKFADLVIELNQVGPPKLALLRGSTEGLTTTGNQVLQLDGNVGEYIEGNIALYDLVFAAGDFNRDGRADLVVGAPLAGLGIKRATGNVRVIFGKPTGLSLSGSQLIHQDIFGVPEIAEEYDGFGTTLAVGDFNGDTMPDLAVGVPGEDNGIGIVQNSDSPTPQLYPNLVRDGGAVNVFFGNGLNLTTKGSHILLEGAVIMDEGYRPEENPEEGDQNGSALAAGDFDDDGFTDLAVGAPGENGGRGSVSVFYGSSSGFDGDQFWTEELADPNAVSAPGDRFGASLTAADFGRHYNHFRDYTKPLVGDGITRPCDLVIGIPGKDVGGASNAGAARVIYGYYTGLGISTFGYSPGPFPLSPGPSQLFHKNLTEVEIDAEYGAALR